jgi:hypothetical protein
MFLLFKVVSVSPWVSILLWGSPFFHDLLMEPCKETQGLWISWTKALRRRHLSSCSQDYGLLPMEYMSLLFMQGHLIVAHSPWGHLKYMSCSINKYKPSQDAFAIQQKETLFLNLTRRGIDFRD